MSHTQHCGGLGRWTTLLALCVLVIGPSGCATIVKGTSQTITVHKTPSDADLRYFGRPVPDDKLFTIEKRPEIPRFQHLDDAGNRVSIPVTYDVDPLFIVDCLLFIPFILPGLVAVGVDLSTGAWRDVHVEQYVELE